MARGRNAETPTQIPVSGWKDIALRVKDAIFADHIGLIAAGVAFYALLALFPAITACMAIAGILTEPQGIVDQIEEVGQLMPDQAAEIIVGQATSVAGSSEGGLGLAAVFGLLIALFSASRGTSSLVEGLNVAYKESDTRGLIKGTLLTYGLTLALIAGFVLCVAVTVVLPAVTAFLGVGAIAKAVTGVLSWAILIALVIAGLGILYAVGPDRKPPRWRWLTPGAIIATALWAVGSVAFTFYVANFASYNETFGTLGGVIVLLMWLWLSVYIILLGAEINSETEAQTHSAAASTGNSGLGPARS